MTDNSEIALELLREIATAADAGSALVLGPQAVQNLRGLLSDVLTVAACAPAAPEAQQVCRKCGSSEVMPWPTAQSPQPAPEAPTGETCERIPASDRNTIMDAMHYPREYLARWKGKGNSGNAQHTLDRLQNMLERTQASWESAPEAPHVHKWQKSPTPGYPDWCACDAQRIPEAPTDLAYVTAQRDIAWGAIQKIKHGPPHWIGVASDDILAWAQSEADKGLAAAQPAPEAPSGQAKCAINGCNQPRSVNHDVAYCDAHLATCGQPYMAGPQGYDRCEKPEGHWGECGAAGAQAENKT